MGIKVTDDELIIEGMDFDSVPSIDAGGRTLVVRGNSFHGIGLFDLNTRSTNASNVNVVGNIFTSPTPKKPWWRIW